MIVFTVWTSQGTVFGGTSMKIFDEVESLKQGKQKLVFYFDEPGSSHLDSLTRSGELYERLVKCVVASLIFHRNEFLVLPYLMVICFLCCMHVLQIFAVR